jgi:hypothetical protein
MTIEAQWLALEAEVADDRNSWRLRLARPLDGHSLFVAVQGGRRHLLLRAARATIPPRTTWPECAGLELLAVELEGHAYFGVALREARFADVFAALAEDLARRIESAPAAEAVTVFAGQLARWRRFLAAAAEGLGEEARRGLWGELHILLEVLLPVLGGAATSGWKGPHAAHQDFQFPGAWIEVKTTLAKQPQTVRITSERQLDDTHAPALFLHVLALEAVEGGAVTLPALVGRVRSALAPWPQAREQFEEALLAARYLDLHAARYEGIGYAVRRADTFRVGPGFPRIVESDLLPGVGDASYGLSLAACESFSSPLAALISALHDATPAP